MYLGYLTIFLMPFLVFSLADSGVWPQRQINTQQICYGRWLQLGPGMGEEVVCAINLSGLYSCMESVVFVGRVLEVGVGCLESFGWYVLFDV